MCENARLDHSFYIYSVVEVNQNTQGTQPEFSDKSSQFYFQQSSSRLQTKPTQQRANTCFQDLVSQLFLMVASFSESYLKNNAAPLLTVSVKQQLVHAKAHTLLLVRNSFTSTVSQSMKCSGHLSVTQKQFYFLRYMNHNPSTLISPVINNEKT